MHAVPHSVFDCILHLSFQLSWIELTLQPLVFLFIQAERSTGKWYWAGNGQRLSARGATISLAQVDLAASNIPAFPGRTPDYLACLIWATWPCHKGEATHRSHLPLAYNSWITYQHFPESKQYTFDLVPGFKPSLIGLYTCLHTKATGLFSVDIPGHL